MRMLSSRHVFSKAQIDKAGAFQTNAPIVRPENELRSFRMQTVQALAAFASIYTPCQAFSLPRKPAKQLGAQVHTRGNLNTYQNESQT